MFSRANLISATPASLMILVIAAMAQAGCLGTSETPTTQTSPSVADLPAVSTASSVAPIGSGAEAQALGSRMADTASPTSVAPLPLLSVAVRNHAGIGSFESFRDGFLNTLRAEQPDGYIDDIRFPLPVTRLGTLYVNPLTGEREVIRVNERQSVSHVEFDSILVHDPEAWSQSVYDLGDAFSGSNTRALYRGNRMLTFAMVDGRWMLTETGLCIGCSSPATLLCARPGRQPELPGSGPDGKEDFFAFFEVFYCAAHSLGDRSYLPHLSTARTEPAGAMSRVRFPLRGSYVEPGDDKVVEFEVTEDRFRLQGRYARDGGESPPDIHIDGDTARVNVHGMASDHRGTDIFTRIDGLWYLTGLGD